MRRIVTYVVMLVAPVFACVAQPLSSEQLEKRWTLLYDRACVLYEDKKYNEAERALNNSINILKQNDADGSLGHVQSLALLGRINNDRQNRSRVEQLEAEMLAIKAHIRPGSVRYVRTQYEIGVYYSSIGQYQRAIDQLQDALRWSETVRSIPGMQSKLLHYMAVSYFGMTNIQRAIVYEKECISHDQENLPEYRIALTYYYYLVKNWTEMEQILPDCYESAREPLLRYFSLSKAADRAIYWGKKGGFFYLYIPTFVYEHYSNPIASYAYDAALFSKGVLLAAENKSTEITLASNDKELIKLFGRFKQLSSKKDRSLEEDVEMEALSDVLLRHQKEHKYDFRTDFRIGWRDVQEQLGDNDIAIEFITIPLNNGTIKYAALSIKKGYSAPHLTKLDDITNTLTTQSSEIYTGNELYNLVWVALEKELEGVENVYFSPAGAFFNTGIEYLPDDMGINFCYKYNTFRLSSTKELVIHKTRTLSKAALFGGANFDLFPLNDTSSSQRDFHDSVRSISFDSLRMEGFHGGSVASGFSYLPGTRKEVDAISKFLVDAKKTADLYTGDNAKESAFKRLSGTNIGIIHVATHGFYYTAKGTCQQSGMASDFHNMNYSVIKGTDYISGEDKRLTRSGLILAGANNTLRNKEGKTSSNDGILYAYEIAGLNLNNVDLIVLSACQSGLGDIDASEGVFGLQRSFKLAGANSLVMSLWKVNDEATRILMTEMYKNLYSGQTKREALANAQLALRSYNNGIYDRPEFWAAFVLLDALDQ